MHELARNPPFDLVLTIRKRRLRYLGHILRMEQDRLVKRTLIALTKDIGLQDIDLDLDLI